VVLSFKVGQNENVCCRGDDSGTDKGIVHGWNFDRPWQFHHIPDRCMFATILSCNGGHHFYVSFTTSTRDLWPFWWCGFVVGGPSCVPWPKRKHFGVFWRMWFQVPRQKGCCWFLARGEHIQFPSSKTQLSYNNTICYNYFKKSLNLITFKKKCFEGKICRILLIHICTQLEYHALMNFSFLLKIWTFLWFFISMGFMSIPKPSGKKCLIGF